MATRELSNKDYFLFVFCDPGCDGATQKCLPYVHIYVHIHLCMCIHIFLRIGIEKATETQVWVCKKSPKDQGDKPSLSPRVLSTPSACLPGGGGRGGCCSAFPGGHALTLLQRAHHHLGLLGFLTPCRKTLSDCHEFGSQGCETHRNQGLYSKKMTEKVNQWKCLLLLLFSG